MSRGRLLLGTALGLVLLTGSARAQCTFSNAGAYWGCMPTLPGTIAQTTDVVLGYRASLGQPGQAPLTVQQITSALNTLHGTIAMTAPTSFTSTEVYSSPTINIPSITSWTTTANGTIGGGLSAPKAVPPAFNNNICNDSVTLNNSAVALCWHWKEFLKNATGTHAGALLEMVQVNSTPTDNGRTSSYTGFGNYVQMNADSGGTLPSQTNSNGFVYAGNPKVSLLDGALNYTLANDWGEGDIAIAPARRSITASGSVTVGETDTIELASVACGFDIPLTVTAASGDTLGIVLNKFFAQVISNDTLSACGIGGAMTGATSPTPNTLEITAPPNNMAGVVDITVTFPPSSGGATAVYSVGAPTAGASVQTKVGLTIVETRNDGVAGAGGSSVFGIAKQGGGLFPPTSGGWSSLFTFIGTTNQFDSDDSAVVPGIWPLDRLFNGFLVNIPTGYAGSNDAPILPPRMSSLIDLPNVEFLLSDVTTGLGPIVFPGYMLKGDGSQWIGSGSISRLVGNAGTVGIQIQSNGTEATAISLNAAGGPGGGTLTGRYYAGDITTCGYGDFEKIDTITANGGVATFHVITDGTRSDYPSAGPGVATSGTCTPLGGSGSGLKYNTTWTAGNTVIIGNATNKVDLEGALSMFNGVVVTAPTCGGTGVITGTANNFSVQIGGTSSATCTITPASNFASKPVCSVTAEQLASGPTIIVPAVGSLVITAATASTNGIFDVHCFTAT